MSLSRLGPLRCGVSLYAGGEFGENANHTLRHPRPLSLGSMPLLLMDSVWMLGSMPLLFGLRRRLPLTLTSPRKTGRGDVPRESEVGTERARQVPSPRLRGEGGGRRMRGGRRSLRATIFYHHNHGYTYSGHSVDATAVPLISLTPTA
ncbi:hypothetical protein CO655_07515 [Rhizobium sp. M1]|nr:hypothetical protein CO655_07515 [Rhizobium sp. M1]